MIEPIFSSVRPGRGHTLVEILIALFITAVIVTAAFRFYVLMHQQVITQQEISDMQQTCRSSLNEISKTVRMAGYKLSGHPPYKITGDSLFVFFSDTHPVDTVLYFLEEFTESEYATVGGLPEGMQLWKLKKQVNSETPAIYSDFIREIVYTLIDSCTILIALQVQAARCDETVASNYGFRTFTNTERAEMRNVLIDKEAP